MANYVEFEDKMKKTLTALSNDYAGLRAGRANPSVLDKVLVEYYADGAELIEHIHVALKSEETATTL